METKESYYNYMFQLRCKGYPYVEVQYDFDSRLKQDYGVKRYFPSCLFRSFSRLYFDIDYEASCTKKVGL